MSVLADRAALASDGTAQPSRLMSTERATLRRLLPALATYLEATPLSVLEAPGSDAIATFRDAGGCGLIAPTSLGGLGATAVEALRVHRAIGAASPSLAAAVTMHHLSIATIIEIAMAGPEEELPLVAGLIEQKSIIASGFAEGVGSTLVPSVDAYYDDGDYVVNGSKKPCSLSASMDFLAASVATREKKGGKTRKAVALIPASMPGVSVRPFWTTPVLAGAESEEVVLEDVRVPVSLTMVGALDDPEGMHELTGFLWFGILASAGYIGAATALVERLVGHPKVSDSVYTSAAAELEAAIAGLEAVAAAMDSGERGADLSARLLFCRIALRGALRRAVDAAVTALGGIAFITDPDIAYLQSVVSAFAFHPPSIRETESSLAAYHRGENFSLA
ncbi:MULTISPECIES: acyl-CoA dehydrogenase family protein [Nocardiaceae]|uniref:Alkylation response protein AidB-like acyl-CoA dehydrogenase n=1 Tax=Rhodococcoides corynebacterioides TaxID=53972 RepID=A0ABS2KW10_9NOCA|nr:MULTISPECIES: acyl-CoA dehydrogenase family protein [Rhodococcus]MBM7416130.1 alkylation response protein AidB-like acyl-CoA dehydrogenase [Rhodococcus corynebacterioides]MBP1114383.1 alkylation response protein AidB-like acyl-CoA dehydrogenase [Rhodococcus sp. PvP016]